MFCIEMICMHWQPYLTFKILDLWFILSGLLQLVTVGVLYRFWFAPASPSFFTRFATELRIYDPSLSYFPFFFSFFLWSNLLEPPFPMFQEFNPLFCGRMSSKKKKCRVHCANKIVFRPLRKVLENQQLQFVLF